MTNIHPTKQLPTGYWRILLRLQAGITGDSGGALVELALAISLVSTLLLGAAEFGRLAYASIEVTNAAHAGAHYGAQSHTTAADNAGMKTAATQDAANVSGMTATATHTCACADGTASTCQAADCAASRILVYVQVNTSATVDPLIYVPGLPKTYTVKGKAVMKVVQ